MSFSEQSVTVRSHCSCAFLSAVRVLLLSPKVLAFQRHVYRFSGQAPALAACVLSLQADWAAAVARPGPGFPKFGSRLARPAVRGSTLASSLGKARLKIAR